MPGPGSTRSSFPANRRARWRGARTGRLVPMRGPLDPAIDPEEPQIEPPCALPRPLHSGAQFIQQMAGGGRQVFRRRDRLGEGCAGDMGRDGPARRDRLRRDRQRQIQAPGDDDPESRGDPSARHRSKDPRSAACRPGATRPRFQPAASIPRPAIPPEPDDHAPAVRWRSAPHHGAPFPRRRRAYRRSRRGFHSRSRPAGPPHPPAAPPRRRTDGHSL